MGNNADAAVAAAFPPRVPDSVLDLVDRDAARAVRARETDAAAGDPYRAQQHGQGWTYTAPNVSVHSYFRDLLVVAEFEARSTRSLERALAQGGRGGRDEGPLEPRADGFPGDTVEAARSRLMAAQKRDLSASGTPDMLRPSAPGWLAERWGRASRQTSTLADAFERQSLERGMTEASGGQIVLKIPRLATGAAVAVQASENAAVQETDPTTSSATAPVGTVAGHVDSRGSSSTRDERSAKVIWETVVRVAKRAVVQAHVHAIRAAFAVHYLETHPGDLEALEALMSDTRSDTTQGLPPQAEPGEGDGARPRFGLGDAVPARLGFQ